MIILSSICVFSFRVFFIDLFLFGRSTNPFVTPLFLFYLADYLASWLAFLLVVRYRRNAGS